MNRSAFFLSLLITFGLSVNIDKPPNRAIAHESGVNHTEFSNSALETPRDFLVLLDRSLL